LAKYYKIRILGFLHFTPDPAPDPDQDNFLFVSGFQETNKNKFFSKFFSVADPGCLSRIPYPDFYPSRILDPKTATKERGEKKFLSYFLL
jgi:hypothetical protein